MNKLVLNIEIQDFIDENLNIDTNNILLKGTAFNGVETKEIINGFYFYVINCLCLLMLYIDNFLLSILFIHAVYSTCIHSLQIKYNP